MKVKALTRVKEKRKHSRVNLYSFLRNRVLPLAIVFMFIAQIGTPFFVSAENNTNYGSSKQAPDSNATVVYVDTWSDIEKLGIETNGAYVVNKDCTIILKNDVVAASPIIFEGTVHITSNDNNNKTIYRDKGNTNFTVFTVNNNGYLTLGENVVMTGKVAQNYENVYTLIVTDGVGNALYKKHVYPNESNKSVKDLLAQSYIYYSKKNGNEVIFEEDAEGTQGPDWDREKWSLSEDSDKLNTIFKTILSDKNNSPHVLGYTFNGWDFGDIDPEKQMSQINEDVTVVAKWNGHYRFRVTDGCGNTIYEDYLEQDETRSCLQIMTAADLIEENRRNQLLETTLSGKNGPFTDGYVFKSWNYGEVINTRPYNKLEEKPSSVTVIAEWEEPERDYVFKVTDANGNEIYKDTNADKTKTIIALMQNAGGYDLTTPEGRDAAFAAKLSEVDGPYKHEYIFEEWNYGKKGENNINSGDTLSSVGGNLTVVAKWRRPPETIEYTWVIPDPPENDKPIQIGLDGKFVSVNDMNVTTNATGINISNTWIIKDVQSDGRFRLYKEDRNRYLAVVQNGVSGMYNSTMIPSSSLNSSSYPNFFEFEKDNSTNPATYYLKVRGSFSGGVSAVYLNWNEHSPVWFTENKPNSSANPYVGVPSEIKEFDDSDVPGYSEADPKINPKSGCDIYQPTERPGKQTPLGIVEQAFTRTDNPGGTTNNTLNSEKLIDLSKLPEDARYSLEKTPNTERFDKTGFGFFVQVNNGTLDIDGAVLTELKTGEVDAFGVVKQGTTVTESAPVVVNGGSLNFNSGEIKNNEVGYIANDNCSGMQAQGRNNDSAKQGCNFNGVESYIKDTAMTNTAGGIIFTNGAKGEISGNATIRENRGDVGGILVQNPDTDVTIGGKVVYEVTDTIPSDKSYFILGTDDKYYVVDTDNPSLSDELPQDVRRKDNNMYDARVDSSDNGGHIDNNVGFHHAGAALVENGALLRMVGSTSTMNNNVTWAKGGAVWATEFGTAGYAKIDYTQKKLVNKHVKDAREEGTFVLVDGLIDNNTAFLRGGGINVESDHVYLIGGTISNNNSRVLGGGIYVEGDFPEYTYTLVINKGYVGNNYSVRYWNIDTGEKPGLGSWGDLTLSELNDRLDRRIGSSNNEPITNTRISNTSQTLNNNHNSPLNDESKSIAKGDGYGNRTADTWAYPNPHEGNGGGIWLCPIGGTAVFHMNADNEVIIDDNYASGRNNQDKRRGTDLYLHSGTGHMLVQNDTASDTGQALEIWKNEETNKKIPDNSPVYSGPLYLYNDTPDDIVYTDSHNITTTYGQRKEKATHKGVHIIDNLSRDGGGIAANGTLLFGLPNDVYRHEAELGVEKIWPDSNDTYPVTFKMYYLNDQGIEVELPEYEFGLNGTDNEASDYEYSPETQSTSSTWKARTTIPISVELPDGSSYPMYTLRYNGEAFTHSITTSATENSIEVNSPEDIDPSTAEGMKKLFAISERDKANGTNTELTITNWKLVLKEFDASGNEVRTAEFSHIISETVTVSFENSISIDVIDAGGVGKTIKGYKINFSRINFQSKVKNGIGPEVEKYINDKVHQDLAAFDKVFEYEIMAYVPIDATELIIYDTLEDPLMFVDRNGNSQFTTVENTINSEFMNTTDNDPTVGSTIISSSATSYLPLWINDFDLEPISEVTRVTRRNNNSMYFAQTSKGFYKKDNGVWSLITDPSWDPFENNPQNITELTQTNGPVLELFDENNHKGNGKGTVSTTGESFVKPVYKDGYILIGNAPLNESNVQMPATNNPSGNTLYVKIDNQTGIEKVRGKWVKVTFNAAIKPSYRSIDSLKSDDGWLTNEADKKGDPLPGDYYTEKSKLINRLQTYLSNLEGKNLYIAKVIETDNRLYAKVLSTIKDQPVSGEYQYYQLNLNGDRNWYRTYYPGSGGNTYRFCINDETDASDSHGSLDSKGVYLQGIYYIQGLLNNRSTSGGNAGSLYTNGECNEAVLIALEKYLSENNDSVKTLKSYDRGQIKIYIVETKNGDYYQRVRANGNVTVTDGVWYKTELASGNTKLTPLYGDPKPFGTLNEVDGNRNQLEGFNAVRNNNTYGDAESQVLDYETFRGIKKVNYGYNWPVVEAQEPHAGESNRAKYFISRTAGSYLYKTNIVTVDVANPEKYVNAKVHDVLGDNDEGYFDQMFEYTILVYVPEDAEHVQIYDTLRPDLMFVDYLGNTQYKAFVIGTKDSNGDLIVEDVYNEAFKPNQPRGNNNNIKNRIITNEGPLGAYYLLIKDSNDHIGDGVSGTASKRSGSDGTHLNDPILGNNGSYIKVGNLVNNPDGSVSIDARDTGNTVLINITKETLDAYDTEHNKNPQNRRIRGNWIQATFRAQIRPSSYPYVVKKLEKKEDTLTTEKTQAVDYNSTTQTAAVAAYKIKSSDYLKYDISNPFSFGTLYYVDATNNPEKLTTSIVDAADYNPLTHEATSHGYLYDDGNGNYTMFSSFAYAIPAGRDYKKAYADKNKLDSITSQSQMDSIFESGKSIAGPFVANDFDTVVYTKPSGTAVSDYLELYESKNWNASERWGTGYTGPYNWEEVLDDKTIVNPKDLNSEGNHAGLANDAKYIVKFDNDYHSMTTNTVTVEPKLRDIEITKKWIVDEDFDMPTMEEFKNYLHLWWEKTESNGNDSESDKVVGEITNLTTINEETFYRDHIEITYEEAPATSQEDVNARYYWKITVKNLPVLRPSMKYFITEDKLPNMNIPQYNNLNDTTTEHAHDKGGITNIQEDLEDETHVEVSKIWDVGQNVDSGVINDIEVKLMYEEEDGSKTPVYQRDDDGKIIYEENVDGNYILATDGNYYEKTSTLPAGVNNEEEGKFYSPKEYSRTLKGSDPTPWSYVFTKLPLYRLDDEGNKIPKVVNGKNAYLDETGKEFFVDMNNGTVYDGDATTELNYEQKTERGIDVRINGSVTVGNTISYVICKYTVEIMKDPDGYILAYETETIINHHYEYTMDSNHAIYFDEEDNPIQVGSFLNNEGVWNKFTNNISDNDEDCTNQLPETTSTPCKAYVEKDIEYPVFEIEIVNSKPEIEKYINKDVHQKVYFTNSFVYDILVYVPEEATEIEIHDEVMDTLVLDSFLIPEYDHENIISDYIEKTPSEMNNSTIELVVHGTNNHTINGTVASKNSAGIATGTVVVDGNKFSIKVSNIHHWGADYIEDANGYYIKASNNQYYKVKGDNIDYNYNRLTESLLKDGLTRIDDKFYTHIKKQSTYIEDADGDYILADDGNYYPRDMILPSGVNRDGDKYYTLTIKQGDYQQDPNGTYVLGDDNNYYPHDDIPDGVTVENPNVRYIFVENNTLNLIGGRYVQVSFKAKFNHVYDEQLKDWTENITSSFTPKSDLDWDVITDYVVDGDGHNKGWDQFIIDGLKAASLPDTTKYIESENSVDNVILQLANAIGSNNINKIVKSNDPEYYAAKDNNNNYYLYPIAGNQSSDLKNRWLYVAGGPIYYELDRQTEVYHGPQGVGLGGINAYRHDPLKGYVSNNANPSLVSPSSVYVPVEPDEFVKINEKYYLREVAKRYAPDYDDSTATVYRKVDWGRGDGDVIRNDSSPYSTKDHAGVVNTASYEVTYGNRIKSNHKSNTVTVVPEIYELPSSGGIGTFLFNILGVMFITMALTEFVLKIRLRRKGL